MTTKFIIESFWQKKANCVSVAFMKALLLKNGISCGLKTRKKDRYILVFLKDGKVLSFNKTELRSVNHKNQLSFARYTDERKRKLIERIKANVELCFAVQVRNLQLRGYAGKELTQSGAAKMLTHEGADTTHFHSLMGVKRRSSKLLTAKNFKLIKKKKAVLIFNSRHITICSEGYYEEFGKAIKLGEEIPELLGKKASHWFEVK